MHYETTTLPAFRLMLTSVRTNNRQHDDDKWRLWQDFHATDFHHKIPAFSQSIYCIYHDFDHDDFTISLGKLITPMVEHAIQGTQILAFPAQHYAVFPLPDFNIQAAKTVYQTTKKLPLKKNHHCHFECYPPKGSAKLYIGLTGKVHIKMHSLAD